MNIVEISGGLGNQMFQYALYKAFLSKGIETELDISYYSLDERLRELEITRFPYVNYQVADRGQVSVLRGYGYHDALLDKIRHRLFKSKKKVYEENLDKGFQPEVFDLQDTYVSGYWQCERYFIDICDEIRNEFCFPDICTTLHNKDYDKILSDIQRSNSVSLHIRRSDYLDKGLINVYGNICTPEYYFRAVQYLKKNISSPVFFVFSDDVEWAKNNAQSDMIIVNKCSAWDGMADLFLMKNCKHHIIANSSFSWWGAWLGENRDKLVVAPKRWFNNHEQTDMICKEWIQV